MTLIKVSTIGLTHPCDFQFVIDNHAIDPEYLIKHVVTEANITCGNSIDNNASIPLAARYPSMGGKTG